tara:strand:+ start:33 stop:1085 length:1053 start_codon:yes stop_codon:yes gene_type:complete
MNDQITSIIDDNKEIELKEIELIDDNKEIESETFIEIDSVIDDEEITFEIDNLEDPNPKNFSGKIQKYYKYFTNKLIKIVNEYVNLKYLHEIFSTILGMTSILLIIVLFSDLNPNIIPFKIAPINFTKIPSLTRQLSIFFTFLSFMTTDMLFMRVVLSLSFGLGIFSFGISPKPLDFCFVLWYFLIFLINIKHVLLLCYEKRHITFSKNFEKIYKNIFSSLMTRVQYNKLIEKSLVREIKKERYYAKFGDTCNNLTILISGKMKKFDKQNKTSYVKQCSFIDSPEFIMRSHNRGETFNVSFYAETDCNIIIWPREIINIVLKEDNELNSLLLASLGIDVSDKVFLLDLLK